MNYKIMVTNSTNKLKNFIIKILRDKNAQKIKVIRVKNEPALSQYMIFASGKSVKNITATAENIIYKLKHNMKWNLPFSKDFYNSTWILLDLGEVMVHIFHPEAREKLKLEELYSK